MKIALCLSGQPRYLEIGFDALFKNFISKYNVDVFAHIWFDEKLIDTNIDFCIPYNRSHKWEKDADKKVIELYKPKKTFFEPPKQFSLEPFKGANFELIAPNNVLSMFYSIKQANNLKCAYENENNFEYDLVIRARTDLILQNNLNFSLIDKNKIYYYGLGQTMFDNISICNDQFALGSSKLMNIYSGLFDLLEFYWATYKPPSMVGERILTTHLHYSKTPIYCCNNSELYVNIHKG